LAIVRFVLKKRQIVKQTCALRFEGVLHKQSAASVDLYGLRGSLPASLLHKAFLFHCKIDFYPGFFQPFMLYMSVTFKRGFCAGQKIETLGESASLPKRC